MSPKKRKPRKPEEPDKGLFGMTEADQGDLLLLYCGADLQSPPLGVITPAGLHNLRKPGLRMQNRFSHHYERRILVFELAGLIEKVSDGSAGEPPTWKFTDFGLWAGSVLQTLAANLKSRMVQAYTTLLAMEDQQRREAEAAAAPPTTAAPPPEATGDNDGQGS